MDQLAKPKQNLTAAQKAELEARQRHEAAKNKVTSLRSNLERLQSAHDSQIGVLGRERKSYVTTRNGRLYVRVATPTNKGAATKLFDALRTARTRAN
jgi:hypothetical protein